MSKKQEIPKRGGGRPALYPWRELSVGDSFFIEGARHGSVSGAMRYASIKYKMKFVVRQEVKKTGEHGLRIYRKS